MRFFISVCIELTFIQCLTKWFAIIVTMMGSLFLWQPKQLLITPQKQYINRYLYKFDSLTFRLGENNTGGSDHFINVNILMSSNFNLERRSNEQMSRTFNEWNKVINFHSIFSQRLENCLSFVQIERRLESHFSKQRATGWCDYAQFWIRKGMRWEKLLSDERNILVAVKIFISLG